jgi:hypothetical protein
LALEERTWLDHWFSEEPDDKPYYQRAGLAYLADALKQVSRSTEVEKAKERLNRPDMLRIVGPAELALTSELDQALTYRVERLPEPAALPGLPVISPQPGPALELARPDTARWVPHEGDERTSFVVKSPILRATEKDNPPPPRLPHAESSSLTVRGFFRGKSFELQTAIELHTRAEVVRTKRNSAPRGTIAVRADEEVFHRFGDSDGTVVIVLDCSGSMGPPSGQAFDAATKYSQATSALRQVLAQISKGTRVSLWVFGEALGAEKLATDVERTIRPVMAPTEWHPEFPAQLERIMKQITFPTIEPWNNTPLLRTMLRARADFKDDRGF